MGDIKPFSGIARAGSREIAKRTPIANVSQMIRDSKQTAGRTFTINAEPLKFVFDPGGIPLFVGNPENIYHWLSAERRVPAEMVTADQTPENTARS